MAKKFISIRFLNNSLHSINKYSNEYQFITDIENLQSGDKVVVDTINGYSVAEVVSYQDRNTSIKEYKWVVQKIDMENHQVRIEKERQLNVIKRKMENRRKQLEEIQIFELLAKEDSGMQEMLEQYRELSK